ncbi:MAG: hypothetical protein AAFW98_12065, partial [Pseudomonadota bacterium]
MRTLLTVAVLSVAGLAVVATATAQEIEFVDNYRAWNLDDYEAATGNTVPPFTEAPALTALVEAGELPPVAERLPAREDVLVVQPRDTIGTYGGTIRYNATNPQSFGNMGFTAKDVHLAGFTTNWEQVFPEVARDIVLADDQMSATVTLRQGMRWSDGE